MISSVKGVMLKKYISGMPETFASPTYAAELDSSVIIKATLIDEEEDMVMPIYPDSIRFLAGISKQVIAEETEDTSP